MKTDKINIKKMTGVAIFVAIVIVLQMIGSFIKFGIFSVTLVLVPIIIGGAFYGAATGALLGGAFGAVVLINCVNGVDAGGYMLWAVNPILTAALCLIKGVAAGYFSGVVYSRVSRKNKYAGVISAAVLCPVVNTGIFLIALILLYSETLAVWAGGSDILYFVLMTFIVANFIPELLVNIILCPTILRIINSVKS